MEHKKPPKNWLEIPPTGDDPRWSNDLDGDLVMPSRSECGPGETPFSIVYDAAEAHHATLSVLELFQGRLLADLLACCHEAGRAGRALAVARLGKQLGACVEGDPYSPGNEAYIRVAAWALYLYTFGTPPDGVKVTSAMYRLGQIATELLEEREREPREEEEDGQ